MAVRDIQSIEDRQQILQNMTVSWESALSEQLIAEKVCPRMETGKRAGRYFVYDRRDLTNTPDVRAGVNSELNIKRWSGAFSSYYVNDYGIKTPISALEIEEAADVIDVEENTVATNLYDMKLAKEKRVADLYFTSANYTNTAAVGTKWTVAGAGTPILDIDNAIAALLVKPNTMIIGEEAFNVMKNHPDVIDRIKYTGTNQNPAQAMTGALASLFQLSNGVFVGKAQQDTANKAQTEVLARLWGKHVALLYIDPNPRLKSLTFAMTIAKGPQEVNIIPDDTIDPKPGGEWVKIFDEETEKLIAELCGYLLTAAVA